VEFVSKRKLKKIYGTQIENKTFTGGITQTDNLWSACDKSANGIRYGNGGA